MSAKKSVLFVCIENSCRSQMAEAFAHLDGADKIAAASAGSHPSGEVNPKAVTAMAELGYDLSPHRSKSLEDVPRVRWDYVITMGCGDQCPFIPAEHHEDWAIPDPKNLPLDEFRKVRDMIQQHVAELLMRV
jgi:arsenate reductase